MMSLLNTDGYKFSMAEADGLSAGNLLLRPTQRQRVHSALRRGGGAAQVHAAARRGRLRVSRGQRIRDGAGFKAAILLHDRVEVRALPKGLGFCPRTGFFHHRPVGVGLLARAAHLHLHYRIQVATLARTDPSLLAREVATVTCEEQKNIVLSTLDAVGVRAPPIAVDSRRTSRG